jgi:hypothetical protein
MTLICGWCGVEIPPDWKIIRNGIVTIVQEQAGGHISSVIQSIKGSTMKSRVSRSEKKVQARMDLMRKLQGKKTTLTISPPDSPTSSAEQTEAKARE